MFTLVAYSESQDSAVLVNVAALADQHITFAGDDIVIPDEVYQIVGVYGVGPNLTRAQILSPSLRQRFNLELIPLDVAAVPSSPYPFIDRRRAPIALEPNELMNAQAAEDNAAAARATILVWLADRAITPIVGGEVFTVRATGATTLVANAWTNGTITLDQQLPVGRYQVVGARARSTGLQAFRLVFRGYAWRPGGIGVQAVSDLEHEAFRQGGFGVWGEFRHNLVPTVDYLSNSADTAETLELDLLKVE